MYTSSNYYAQYLLSASGWLLNCKTLRKKKWSNSGYTVSINSQSINIPARLVKFITSRRLSMLIHEDDPYGFQLRVDRLHQHIREHGHCVTDPVFLPMGNIYTDMLYLPEGSFGLGPRRFYQKRANVYIDPIMANSYRIPSPVAKAMNEFFTASPVWIHHASLYCNLRVSQDGRVVYPKLSISHLGANFHLQAGGRYLFDDQDYLAGKLCLVPTPLGPKVSFCDYVEDEDIKILDSFVLHNELIPPEGHSVIVPSSAFY